MDFINLLERLPHACNFLFAALVWSTPGLGNNVPCGKDYHAVKSISCCKH